MLLNLDTAVLSSFDDLGRRWANRDFVSTTIALISYFGEEEDLGETEVFL
jgi:hypothetical protein